MADRPTGVSILENLMAIADDAEHRVRRQSFGIVKRLNIAWFTFRILTAITVYNFYHFRQKFIDFRVVPTSDSQNTRIA